MSYPLPLLEALSRVMLDTDPRWPCTEFAARLIRGALVHSGEAPYHNGTSLADGDGWWQDMNVWRNTAPWSAPHAMRRLLGWEAVDLAHHLEDMAPGMWHLAQGWTELPGPARQGSGHLWLMRAVEGGDIEVLESSESLGFRHTTEPAYARWQRYTAGVLAVPLWPDEDPLAEEAPMAKRKIKIPWAKLKELAGALLAAGVDKDQIPEIIGQGLDDLIDFDELMNGPLEVVGDTLELIDGMVFTAAARLIVGIIPAPKLIAFAKDRQAARLVA